jgi:hypothetical protein
MVPTPSVRLALPLTTLLLKENTNLCLLALCRHSTPCSPLRAMEHQNRGAMDLREPAVGRSITARRKGRSVRDQCRMDRLRLRSGKGRSCCVRFATNRSIAEVRAKRLGQSIVSAGSGACLRPGAVLPRHSSRQIRRRRQRRGDAVRHASNEVAVNIRPQGIFAVVALPSCDKQSCRRCNAFRCFGAHHIAFTTVPSRLYLPTVPLIDHIKVSVGDSERGEARETRNE